MSDAVHRKAEERPHTGRMRALPTTWRGAVAGAARPPGITGQPLGELAGFHPTIALHVALHDPARVLREIEAKRHVLARHLFSPAIGDPELPWDNRDDCQYDGEPWPCDDLLDLALPYVDHPDYPRHL